MNELGFVGVNLNPDPSGGYWTDPPLTDKYWYPIYEKLVRASGAGDDPCHRLLQSDFPSHRRALHQCRHHGLHAALQGNLFKDFPT